MPWKSIPASKAEGGWRDVYEEPGKEGMTHFKMPTLTESVFDIETGVDYKTGVKDGGLRADFSKADTDAERGDFLTKKVGAEGWRTDRNGRYLLTTKGMDTIGLQATQDTAIDEVWPSLYDIADWRGDAPAIAGGMAGAALTGGMSILPSMAMVGIGAAGAQGYQESSEALQGKNLQSSGEVATDLAIKGGAAALGEGLYKGLIRPLGRKLAAPYKSQMTPDKVKVLSEAREIGVQPSFGQIVESSLPGRYSRISERIFGDPRAPINAEALSKESARLNKSAYPVEVTHKAVGRGIHKGILKSKRAFMKAAGKRYDKADAALGNEPIVPTRQIKQQMIDILENLPKSKDGQPVFVSADLKKYATDIASIDDKITVSEMKNLRTFLMDAASSDKDVIPGLGTRHLKRLISAASKSFDDVARIKNIETAEALMMNVGIKHLRDANKFYRQGVSKFDDAMINNIVKDRGARGAIDHELVVDAVFKPGKLSQLSRVMSVLPKKDQLRMQGIAMKDLLDSAVKRTDDPFTDLVNGKAFLDTLDKYKKPTLVKMFGKEKSEELYKFGRVAQLISKKQKDQGGLIAAAIAVRPLQNIGTLAKLRVWFEVFNHPRGLKWLTTGLEIPKTRKGIEAMSRFSILIATTVEDQQTTTE